MEEHGIVDSALNDEEWIEIQSSDQWKESQIQVIREIVARKLIKKFQIDL